MNRRTGMPRRAATARTVMTAMAAIASMTALTACQGAYDLPLPGGAAGGSDVYRVTADFADVLDLVPQSSVKVDQVTVGTVEKIELHGWTARVTLRLPNSVKLPDNAIAELKQTSLLGEKYVQLGPPTDIGPVGSLGDGDNIPVARTGRNVEVEEVLSALSLLLNGGGVAQLKLIQAELSKALSGNESQIRDLLVQLNTFVGGLDQQKAEIVRALDGIDALSAKIAARKDDLGAALEALPKGLKVLADQRQQLTAMLTALSNLGAVGTRVISASKEDTVANLAALAPILSQLTLAGDNLPKSLQLLFTYPFPDKVPETIVGDYNNLYVTSDLDLRNVAGNLGLPPAPTTPGPGLPTLPPPPIPSLPIPSLPPLPLPLLTPPLPLGPSPSTSPNKPPCLSFLCLGQGFQGSSQASGSTSDSWQSGTSWLSLMRTGGAV